MFFPVFWQGLAREKGAFYQRPFELAGNAQGVYRSCMPRLR